MNCADMNIKTKKLVDIQVLFKTKLFYAVKNCENNTTVTKFILVNLNNLIFKIRKIDFFQQYDFILSSSKLVDI